MWGMNQLMRLVSGRSTQPSRFGYYDAETMATMAMSDNFKIGWEQIIVCLTLLAISLYVLSKPSSKMKLKEGIQYILCPFYAHKQKQNRIQSQSSLSDEEEYPNCLDLKGDKGYLPESGDKNDTTTPDFSSWKVGNRSGKTTLFGTPPSSPLRKCNSSPYTISCLNTQKTAQPSDPKNTENDGMLKKIDSSTEKGSTNIQEQETDHERYTRAYNSHIRFASYRKLILPPECQLLDPKKLQEAKLKTKQLAADDSDDAFLSFSFTREYMLHIVKSTFDSIEKIWNFDYIGTTCHFNYRIWKAIQVRWYKIMGWKWIDDEEEDDEEDDATVGSISSRKSFVSQASSVLTVPTTSLTAGTASFSGHTIRRQRSHSPMKVPNSKDASTFIQPTCDQQEQHRPDTTSETPSQSQIGITRTDALAHGQNTITLANILNEPDSITDCNEMEDSIHSMSALSEEQDDNHSHLSQHEPLLTQHSDLSNNYQQPSQPPMVDISTNREAVEEKKDYLNDEILASPLPSPQISNIGECSSELLVPSLPKIPHSKSIITPLRTLITPRQTSGSFAKKKDALESYRRSGSSGAKISSTQIMPHRIAKQKSQNDKSDSTYSNCSNELNYFDTATNDASLRKIVMATPFPDGKGYILGDHFLQDPRRDTPLLVFVNSRSGSQQGLVLKTQLERLLNPIQVWDLADGGPEQILESFKTFSRLRLLVCGGDGTVSWVISALEKMNIERWPPIAILPLGTGNDLARIHGWGAGYANESLLLVLNQVQEAYISLLDRWTLKSERRKKRKLELEYKKSFTNYMSVGMDALSALQVHNLRENSPRLFFSRALNKVWYALFGAEDAIKASCSDMPQQVVLEADGIEVPIPKDSQGLIILNIDSYLGGVPLWSRGIPLSQSSRPQRLHARRYSESDCAEESIGGLCKSIKRKGSYDSAIREDGDIRLEETAKDKLKRITACDLPSSCQDGRLDVISIRGNFHLGQIRVGLSNAHLLCQCSKIKIKLKKSIAVQIDGEPWKQDKATLTIDRKSDPAIMLHRATEEGGGVESEVAKLLDWAEERSIISQDVHGLLMKEFSRRIESKTRERRVRSRETVFSTMTRAIASGNNLSNM